MLTRRQIRVKVVQAVYAQYNGNAQDLKEGVKAIQRSCHDMGLLYLTHLALFKALWEFASEQNKIQTAQRRSNAPLNPHYPRIKALTPLLIIAKHPFLKSSVEQHKINLWELEFDYIRKLFDKITTSQLYQDFSSLETPSFKVQQKFLVELFRDIIAPDEQLYCFIEDLDMQWVDDLPVVNTYLLKQLRKLRQDDQSSLNFPNIAEKKEDIEFGKNLYEKVITNEENLQKEFEGKTPNWDKDRIAALDSLLIKIALAELIYFEDIPPKVTLNEYLEIAKEYSTPKSNQFINGVLDSLVKSFVKDNRIQKHGRGLLE